MEGDLSYPVKEKIIKNVLYSLLEKAGLIGGQFISSILLIRFLERSDYGIIGIVAGTYTFVNIFNLSLEAIIFRDHKLYKKDLNKIFYNFFLFAMAKSFVFISIGLFLSALLSKSYQNHNFIFGIISITSVFIAESFVSPCVIYASSQFEQKIVTQINLCRSLINMFLLLGLIYMPSIKYIAIKDSVIGLFSVMTWYVVFIKKFNIGIFKIDLIRDFDLNFIFRTLFSFSLWSHFAGLITNFIYRSDTFFLSFFTSLSVVGDYNIALNSANIANILPMILGYQNNVALSNAENKESAVELSNAFIRISFYLGIITVLFFIILGKPYLYLVTGQKNITDIYAYMLCIMTSLVIVKTITSPLTSYINIRGNIKLFFFNVLLPVGIFTAIIYYFSAKLFGPLGIAASNIIVAAIWIILILREIKKYGYKFDMFKLKSDYIFIKALIHELQFKNK